MTSVPDLTGCSLAFQRGHGSAVVSRLIVSSLELNKINAVSKTRFPLPTVGKLNLVLSVEFFTCSIRSEEQIL